MRMLPSIDLHAHVDATIDPTELSALEGVVFAVTRSLDEAEVALGRGDRGVVWGVGCHPGLVGAQKAFSTEVFRSQLVRTPFVGEIGLDGKSRVPMTTQRATLRSSLDALVELPRIASLHSYEATAELLEVLRVHCPPGIVLHWWLGTPEQTAEAVALGCYFSVNISSVRRHEVLSAIPVDRIFAETDHPFGDRAKRGVRRPGDVTDVEAALARHFGLDAAAVRTQAWRNLLSLVRQTGTGSLFPPDLRRQLASLPI